MSGSLPKYSSGGIGPKSRPLRFCDINRITRATEIVEGMAAGDRRAKSQPRSHFFASLVAQTGTFGGLPLWSWSQLGADDTGLVSLSGLLTSDQYEDGQGLAIQLGENASAGDNVLLHSIPCSDGVRRFAFAGGGGGGGGLALSITEQTFVSPNLWQYAVEEGIIAANGTFTGNGTTGIMWNLYEQEPFGHGQSLSYGLGTLSVGPLAGVVFGALSTIEDDVRVYICDIPNPMDPECSGGGGVASDPPAVFAPVTSSKTYQILTGGI